MAVHTYHTVTTTDIYPDLRGLAEILVLGYVCVQTMPLCYGWGYTYTRVPLELHPTSISYIYMRCVKCKHLQLLWMGIWLYTHTITTTGCFPKFGRVGCNAKSWCDSANKTVKSKINGMLPWQKITQPESLHMRVPLYSKVRFASFIRDLISAEIGTTVTMLSGGGRRGLTVVSLPVLLITCQQHCQWDHEYHLMVVEKNEKALLLFLVSRYHIVLFSLEYVW
jgi:hypothetical protein